MKAIFTTIIFIAISISNFAQILDLEKTSSISQYWDSNSSLQFNDEKSIFDFYNSHNKLKKTKSFKSNNETPGGPYSADGNTIVLLSFDDNLNNESGTSSNATSTGSYTFSTNTLSGMGSCINLDGNSYLTIPHNENLNLSGDWTIEAWIKISSYNSTHQYIVNKPGNNDDYLANYALQLQPWWDNVIHGFYFSDEETRINVTDIKPNLNQWYHVAFTRNTTNSEIRLIVHDENWNEISSSSRGFSGTEVLLSSKDLRIGEGFIGCIDELRISDVVRDFSYKLDKSQITSENFIIYYDQENSSRANTIINQLQKKTDFYKKYFKYFFKYHSIIFSINICKDLAEFNQFKPSDLPDFETSYLYQEILYILAPSTTAQQGYFDSFEQAAMHGFTMMFVDKEYNNNASEWMRYGFARHQSGMISTPEEIRTEIRNLGRNPTMQEMNNWEQISSFDKYAFAYTIFQYIADVHSFHLVFNLVRFGNNSTNYNFQHIKTEAKFEDVWHYSLDLFYLRTSKLLKLQRETSHFYLYMADEDLPDIVQWASELEGFYTRFTNDMQMTIEHKIHLFYYPALCDFHYIQGRDECDVNFVGHALSIDLCTFVRNHPDKPMMSSMGLAKHELTHVIQSNLDHSYHPRWQSEGLATLMPDGLLSPADINQVKKQVNVEFSKIVAAAGRYPSIEDFESNSFLTQYGLDASPLYYLLGSVIVDYLIKTSGYMGLKTFILSNASDYNILGFNDKVAFMNSFYEYYEETWKIQPQQAIAIKTKANITIDGNFNEQDWDLNQAIEGIYPFYLNNKNNTSRFGTLWDDQYLYVAVEVLDNILNNNSSDGWNDGIEVFIDGDHNRAYQYDTYDRQFKKTWNNSALEEKNNLTTGVLHNVRNISGGYAVEIAIPWSNLGITPSANNIIGFDIANIDNDNGYKYQLIWSGNNINDRTTINFGELTLSSSLKADFTADVTSGSPPLTVNFTDLSSESPTSWEWDFQNDGTIDSYEQNPEWIYYDQGTYTVSLTVSDGTSTDNQVKTDYISISKSPEEPSNPNPANHATSIPVSAILSWTNGEGTETIDLYFGTDNPPTNLILDNRAATTIYNQGSLNDGTDYFWKVICRNTIGATEGPVWSFSTGGATDQIWQNISLNTGWNILSFNVEPDNKNLLNIVQPLIDDEKLHKIIDEVGNILQYMPWGWVNNIGDMANTEGYYAKVTSNVTLSVFGTVVPCPFVVDLFAGWNIMGYPCQNPKDAMAVLQALIDEGKLHKVIDEGGNILQYMPWGWVNNIGDLSPGEGYYIKLSENGSITFEEPGDPVPVIRNDINIEISQTKFFKKSFQRSPYMPMTIVLTDVENIGYDSEIGIFDGDLCVGAAIIKNDILYIAATSDDPYTPEIDGFINGNAISVKVFDKVQGRAYILEPQHIQGDYRFSPLETYIGSLKSYSTDILNTGLENNYLGLCFPNPSSDYTIIEYGLAETSSVTLTVYNQLGKTIRVLNITDQPPGIHQYKIEWKTLGQGIYYYRLETTGDSEYFSESRKIVVK